MPSFAYKALQANGALSEGNIDASSRHEAMRQVELLGLKPIKLAESGNGTRPPGGGSAAAKPSPLGGFKLGGGRKVTPRMLENFTRLLSSLLAAGVPFSRALQLLVREAAEPVAKEKWKQIHDLVIDGMSLHEAMARSPETFPRVYVAMVEAIAAGLENPPEVKF